MFGFLHVLLSLFQQLFNATLLGIVLGLLAVRSRSILPGIVFHFLNNALGDRSGLVAARPRVVRRRVLALSQSGRGSLSWGLGRRSAGWSPRFLFVYLWKVDRPDRADDRGVDLAA